MHFSLILCNSVRLLFQGSLFLWLLQYCYLLVWLRLHFTILERKYNEKFAIRSL